MGTGKRDYSDTERPMVGIVIERGSDLSVMDEAIKVLTQLGIACAIKKIPDPKCPENMAAFVRKAEAEGLEILIAAVREDLHLAGLLATLTTAPVIGVSLDATQLVCRNVLFAAVYMSPGVPVAITSAGEWGAQNAAIHAAQILTLMYPDLGAEVMECKKKLQGVS